MKSHLSKIEEKIVSTEKIGLLLEKWRAQNCKIVFTNGCFDIVHLGHIDYLARAADFGDKFILGLNTDASVSRIKGPQRPIIDQQSRSMVMASLAFVDAVILFDEPTPLELITTIMPNVLIKGADYTIENIIGAKEVIANGGKVKTIPLVSGYSTSNIEKRILDNKT